MSQNLFEDVRDKLRQADLKKIVFPEATDERILHAAYRLAEEGIVTPILIGDQAEIEAKFKTLGLKNHSCEITHLDHYANKSQMIDAFVARRKGKVTHKDAEEILLDANYFGTMLVYLDEADGLVSGAVHATSDTVRPALQIIKTKEGIQKTSGVFIMTREDDRLIFADCAINIAPTTEDLAEIAILSAETAKLFDVAPKIAMLSFSTKGSAVSDETKRVSDAVEQARTINPKLVIEGEIQFDAAFVPEVAQKKLKDSPLQGDANTFIFPSLEAGNIGYKIAQRLGGFEAVGPVLQGLNKPVNDLSRGCSEEDVYKLALITASQAL